ncbi:MAG: hypothetical protein ABIA93_05435 [Candidatus Woesearchaeota archaeon]
MNTTISISMELKEKLKNLGRAGDTYEDVIRKMYEITKENLIHNWLYDMTDAIPIDEARKRFNRAKD